MNNTAKTENSDIRVLLKKMLPWGAVLNVVCWCITLIWGFSFSSLLGFIVGFVYVCFCYVYLGNTCEKAVKLDVSKAKRLMLKCYIFRYLGLFALCALSMLTGYLNVVGILLPQFYPRIILTVMQFVQRKEKDHG